MDNIVLIGLIYDENLGDQAIALSTKQMVKKSLIQNHLKWEIRFLDIYGRNGVSFTHHSGIKTAIITTVKKIVPQKVLHSVAEKKLLNAYLDKAHSIIDKGTRAIIFVGGGLIKFKKQMLCKPIVATIEMAEKYCIPVMFSAVGVEGYDPNNDDCMMLKKSLNSSVVHHVTTRDDLTTLSQNYIINHAIKVKKVPDPACSICNYIKPEKKRQRRSTIGLGVARSQLFSDYGLDVSEVYLTNLWLGIIQRLKDKGFNVKLFTNGSEDDYEYALKLTNKLGDDTVLEKRPKTVKELIGLLSEYNGIIATRMHSCILAYSYNIPACGLVWNNKLKMFGESINRGEYYYEVKELKADVIVDGLLEFLRIGYECRDNTSTEIEIYGFIESVVNKK